VFRPADALFRHPWRIRFVSVDPIVNVLISVLARARQTQVAVFYSVEEGLRETPVFSFITACVAAILIAVVGAVALDHLQEPASAAFSTSAVRL
jgi:integral membrane sensor domain MASE1